MPADKSGLKVVLRIVGCAVLFAPLIPVIGMSYLAYTLYQDPCFAVSWDRKQGGVVWTNLEPARCMKMVGSIKVFEGQFSPLEPGWFQSANGKLIPDKGERVYFSSEVAARVWASAGSEAFRRRVTFHIRFRGAEFDPYSNVNRRVRTIQVLDLLSVRALPKEKL